MDRSLFQRAVQLHGLTLDRLVKEEQGASFLEVDDAKDTKEAAEDLITGSPNDENATKPSPTSSVKQKNERRGSRDENTGDNFTKKLHGFIARKADLLFRQQSDDEDAVRDEISSAKDTEKLDFYAILPPLEQFLEVDPDVSQERLFDVLKVGDLVVGQILSTKEFGIFVKLLALCHGVSRFLDECEVVALLPAGELRDKFSHVASVDDFQIGDLLRAVVLKVNPEEQKVIISLHAKDDSQDNASLGLITESELPVHYRRSVLQTDTQELYEDMLHNSVGFDNPSNVAFLGTKLGLRDTRPLSLMRGLQRSNFPEKEYADPLRKWQTNRWSMESVAKGVEHFKAGRLLDAMQHLNKALEIDEENVEALVARGALYANKDLLSKALQDFGKALKINPNHRNANKYMCQTLVERGKQHEEAGEIDKAVDCYQTAIDIKPDFLEAQLCLDSIKKTRTPAKKVASPESISSPSPYSPEVKLSVEALRQLVDPGESDVSKSAKKSAVKTKKKKKRKEREKDISSRKKDKEEKRGRSPNRSLKKERRYSSSESSSSRSRSRNRSGKTYSRDERKYDKSFSRESKKETRKVRHRSSSYSRSSSSDISWRLRSRHPHVSRRKTSKHAKKQKGRRSSSISRSSSSVSSSSSYYRSRSRSKTRHLSSSKKQPQSTSKRKLEVKHSSRHSVSRSRSCSPYTVSESSLSPPRSETRSTHRSRRKSWTEEQGHRKSTKESKTTARSPSHSISPRSRHRALSASSKESRSNKALGEHSKKLASGVRESKDCSQSSSKSFSRQHSSRTDDREIKYETRGTSSMQNSSLKRTHDVQAIPGDDEVSRRPKKRKDSQKSEQLDSMTLKDGKYMHQSTRYSTENKGRTSVEKKRRGHGRSPVGRGCRQRSRSRSFSSDRSYSDTSYSSVSGSRSYSYSSYSSSGSDSDSDDSRKECRPKSAKSKSSHSKQSRRPASKTSGVKEDRPRSERSGNGEDDSGSDVDTGIYEISRDHLEMYMDSKSYQLKKEDTSPLKRKKRLRSDDEDGVVKDKKTKPGKRKGKATSDEDEDKERKIASISSGKTNSQKTAKPQTFAPKGDARVPPLPPSPSRTSAAVKSLKERLTSHSAVRSAVPPAPSSKISQSESLDPHVCIRQSPAKSRSSGSALKPHQCKEEASTETSTGRDYEVEPSQTFTPEQLSVIDSICNQLAQSRQASSQAASSEKHADPTSGQHHRNYGRDEGRGSPGVTNPVQGHQIGVITSHRSSDTFEQSDFREETLDGSSQSVDNHHSRNRKGRWDVKISEDRRLDAGHKGRSEFAFADSKPMPLSFDYQHGRDISSPLDIEPQYHRETEAFVPGLPRGPEGHTPAHDVDRRRGSEIEIDKLIKESYEHSRQISQDVLGHRGRHGSSGERSGDRPWVESSEYRTDVTKIPVAVVDYQHGKGDVYHERCTGDGKNLDDGHERRCDRHRDRHRDGYNETHHRDHYRSSPERHHRPGRYERKSADRRHHERDRHGYAHRDRHHGRSSSKHGGRGGRSATPVEPKESNPFLQLVSSSKHMQVASLHSKGKWGHDSSPDQKGSSRSWWL